MSPYRKQGDVEPVVTRVPGARMTPGEALSLVGREIVARVGIFGLMRSYAVWDVTEDGYCVQLGEYADDWHKADSVRLYGVAPRAEDDGKAVGK